MTDWKVWLKAAGIRAVRTFCQAAAAAVGTTAAFSQVDWRMVLSTAALSAVLSMLTSLAGLPEAEGEQ